MYVLYGGLNKYSIRLFVHDGREHCYIAISIVKFILSYEYIFMGCPLILRVYQHTFQCQVQLHCHGDAVASKGCSESLQDTLHIQYRDHDGGLNCLLVIILLTNWLL